MLHRVVARMQFPSGSGLPGWCQAQMAVRYGQAQMIRAGTPVAEHPVNTVSGDRFVCDVALADKPAAVDALATLSDHNVLGQAVPLPGPEPEPSFVQYHLCDHDAPKGGCVIVARYDGPGPDVVTDDSPQPWQPWTSGLNADLYQLGDEVTHNGQTWVAVVGNNHWEPGAFGWEVVV